MTLKHDVGEAGVLQGLPLPGGGLHSKRSSQRLEQIAKLRARGLGDHVGLPQLVVCGDQSTGKSSVLEGITGIPFPRQDGLCTRFPTEIILQHCLDDQKILATIIPSTHRTADDKATFRDFSRLLEGFDELPQVIEEVTALFGLQGGDNSPQAPAFARDVLRIEVSGPVGLHLSIVDLPGLIAVANEDQSDDAVDTVNALVDSYLANERTIILAVVQAGNDIANQSIIRKSRKHDPSGARTVGIITKPDLVNEGSERRVALLASNQDTIKLNLGFFLVKNPTPKEIAEGVTPEQRHQVETQYFHDSPYANLGLDPDRTGILALQRFLQNLLDQHVENELPKVRDDIKRLLRLVAADSAAMGEQRETAMLKRLYLTRLSMSFQRLAHSALNGTYEEVEHGFFDAPSQEFRRLRANVHKLNMDFATTMRTDGHKREIAALHSDFAEENEIPAAEDSAVAKMFVTKKEMIAWIREVNERCRGKELPGSYNFVLLAELFRQHSCRWRMLAETHLKKTCHIIEQFLTCALTHVVQDGRVIRELQGIIAAEFEQATADAGDELRKLVEDEQIQPITYNHYYTDNVQNDRQQRLKSIFRKAITQTRDQDWNGRLHISNTAEDIDRLMVGIDRRIVVDMDTLACEEALSGLQAYYKVAMKTFVDNVCRQVVERHLMCRLPRILSPESIASLSETELQRIAGETPAAMARRNQLEALKDDLSKGLADLKLPAATD